MDNELSIAGISISKNVITTIVTAAIQKVEGVASVDVPSVTSGLISMFSATPQTVENSVDSEVVDGGLHITVRVAVFFGYPFTKLAEDIRAAVANAIAEQVGAPVNSVDVCIDDLVFPKE